VEEAAKLACNCRFGHEASLVPISFSKNIPACRQ
jgi:hypothetical protein